MRNVTARSPSADSVRTSAPLLPATTAAVQLVLVPNLRIFSRRARRVFLAGEYPDEDPNSRKKKKCDAKRPTCSTCKAANKHSQCLYEDDAQRNLIQSLVARTRELEERLASAEQSPRNSPPLQGYSAPTPEGLPIHLPTSFPENPYAGLFPAWKPPVLEVLSSNPPELSPRNTLEQYRDFRLLALSYSSHYGMKLSSEAKDALVTGDFYSPYIHPALIHAAQLLGCTTWSQLNRTTPMGTVETLELEATLALLTSDTQPLVALQVHNCLGVYYFIRHMFSEGVESIRMASDLVRRRNLRFIAPATDVWDPMLELSRESEETVCALSHLLYMNIARFVVLGMPSELGPEYEQEFQSIPLMYPQLSRTYLSILRARGILLFHRTRQLSAQLQNLPESPWEHQSSGGLRASGESTWLAEYWSLLEEVEMNLASVNPALLKASLNPDLRSSAHGLKICLIVTLTAEAELHHLAPETHAESRQHCLNAVLKLVGVGKTFSAEDYELLDPVLGLCWLTAAKILFEESRRSMDELSAMNWATARSVLAACAPVLAQALPLLEQPLNQIIGRAASFSLHG
ncbi:hypothetical protein DICSQDRAFT_173382 [Dichomitus squalens LYAD-421 SS1]|uniref:Zn(2)-C6 fungal-type domain-containing protein n=1 Tax=Dichomitus squalens (strain LYAD-421) TaxID=732165 RepID=R7SPZ8_DICSQ|nr:uncharacterized protein DICSQDRAFT_173382 [Dichomitus squalens LYAD-421 SS1]EJF58013.1 hypothetical protein DICSQDRAFT_173382 [Dichomitus squalens LYAD-421 SS1]